ncbi:hypothetical protein [Sorangium sp. So ce1099]
MRIQLSDVQRRCANAMCTFLAPLVVLHPGAVATTAQRVIA